ncbi:MAG: hypothetical protein L0216_07640 [Planctomycetales bacterium]|nr:hypothetical protein [Planctomycetales bacterium]
MKPRPGLVAVALAAAAGLLWAATGEKPSGPPDAGASAAPPGRAEPAVWTAARDAGLTSPRCVAADAARGRVFVLGTDGRVYTCDLHGALLSSFPLPDTSRGNPQGIALARNGDLLVADTHYSRILRLSADGRVRAAHGRRGTGPGEFDWPTAVAEAPDGSLWVSEYGLQDRLQKLSADGAPLLLLGGSGPAPGQFRRPSGLAVAADGEVYVADACNHRVQVLGPDGTYRRSIGGEDAGEASLSYPYDVALGPAGEVILAEYGASRVRVFSCDGRPLASLGGPGRAPGLFACPWGVAVASGLLLVADTGNHRVQAFVLDANVCGFGFVVSGCGLPPRQAANAKPQTKDP